MNFKIANICFLGVLAFSSCFVQSANSKLSKQKIEGVLKASVENIVRPRLNEFKEKAIYLNEAMQALCETPNEENLKASRDEFKKLVHIDESVENFSRSPLAKLHVCGHLDAIFNRLINKVNAHGWKRTWHGLEFECHSNVVGGYIDLIAPEKCQSKASPIKPQKLMAYLSRKLPLESRVFIDTGNIWAWATHYLSHSSNKGLYRVSMDFGSMAWGIGAVIGSALGATKKGEFTNELITPPHVCLSGDGAWLMSSHEIGVAVQHQLPILFIVLNDSALGMIRFGQQLSDAESIGWQLNKVDFAALAIAQGANGIVIETPEQLHKIDFTAIFNATTPTLLDVRIDPNEVPPMMSRVKNLTDKAIQPNAYQ